MGAGTIYTNADVSFFCLKIKMSNEVMSQQLMLSQGQYEAHLLSSCSVDASPPHTRLDWMKNGESLEGNHYLMSPDYLILTINQLATIDDGLYTCKAENAMGIRTCALHYELTVVCGYIRYVLSL